VNAARASEPLIVAGSAADLGAVMRVMDAAFDPAFGEAWTRSQCAGILSLPGVRLLLSADGAGFALARTIYDEAELLLLAVAPDRRRAGLGWALLDAVADDARTAGANRLHLEMRAGNPAAALYAHAGFVEVGRRRNYYRGRDGALLDAITLARNFVAIG
jgi:ribosomal-protein-alanine N-acetyltransferase